MRFWLATVAVLALLGASGAEGAFHGRNGKIVFESTRDGDVELYVMNRDGTGQHRLTRSRGLDGFPEWSPDGRKIAFESNRSGGFDLYVMNANGTRST